MGKLPQTSGAQLPPLHHFSHPHHLQPVPHNPQYHILICSACKTEASGIMYTCNPCNYTLHSACVQLPMLITHPSHPGCNLTLLPVPTYPGGRFNCDACNHPGDGFSYHCLRCNYDLHVLCAKKPMNVTHHAHSCPLQLTFRSPYEGKGFSCDICRQMGSKQWLYRCSRCEFDVHLYCTTASMPNPKPVIHHHHSFPSASNHLSGIPLNHHPHLVHSASTGSQFQTPNNNPSMGGYTSPQMAVPVNTWFVPTSTAVAAMPMPMPMPMQNNTQQQNQQANGNGLGATLMTAAMQGLVEGAFQKVGQTVVEGFIGGGDNGGDGGADYGGYY